VASRPDFSRYVAVLHGVRVLLEAGDFTVFELEDLREQPASVTLKLINS
jgi:hypothetical protein